MAHTNGCWVQDCCRAVPLNSTECGKDWWPWVVVAQWFRALAAQASDLGSILAASRFFYTFPSQPVYVVSTSY